MQTAETVLPYGKSSPVRSTPCSRSAWPGRTPPGPPATPNSPAAARCCCCLMRCWPWKHRHRFRLVVSTTSTPLVPRPRRRACCGSACAGSGKLRCIATLLFRNQRTLDFFLPTHVDRPRHCHCRHYFGSDGGGQQAVVRRPLGGLHQVGCKWDDAPITRDVCQQPAAGRQSIHDQCHMTYSCWPAWSAA